MRIFSIFKDEHTKLLGEPPFKRYRSENTVGFNGGVTTHTFLDDLINKAKKQGINIQDHKSGDTILHRVVKYTGGLVRENHCYELLALGADPAIKNNHGETPLVPLINSEYRYEDEKRLHRLTHFVMSAITKRKMDINEVQNNNGDTLLHLAARSLPESCPLLLALLGEKADPAIKNNKGETPLSILMNRINSEDPIRMEKWMRFCTQLIRAGADAYVTDYEGRNLCTLLHDLKQEKYIPWFLELIAKRGKENSAHFQMQPSKFFGVLTSTAKFEKCTNKRLEHERDDQNSLINFNL